MSLIYIRLHDIRAVIVYLPAVINELDNFIFTHFQIQFVVNCFNVKFVLDNKFRNVWCSNHKFFKNIPSFSVSEQASISMYIQRFLWSFLVAFSNTSKMIEDLCLQHWHKQLHSPRETLYLFSTTALKTVSYKLESNLNSSCSFVIQRRPPCQILPLCILMQVETACKFLSELQMFYKIFCLNCALVPFKATKLFVPNIFFLVFLY